MQCQFDDWQKKKKCAFGIKYHPCRLPVHRVTWDTHHLHLFSIHSKKTRIDRCECLTHFSFFLMTSDMANIILYYSSVCKNHDWLKTICVHLIHGWVLFHSVPKCSVSSNDWRHSTPFTSHWFTSKAKLLSEVFRMCQYKDLASLIYSLAIKAYQVSKHSNAVVPATQRK